MKKYETLKAIVILQAVSMIALAGFVIWYYWPSTQDDEDISPIHDLSKANAEDEVVAVIAEQTITRQQLVEELLSLYGNETLQDMLEHYAIQFASKDYNIKVTQQEIEAELANRAEHYGTVEHYINMMVEQVGISPDKLYQTIEDDLLLMKIAIKDIHISDEDVLAYITENPDAYNSRYALGLQWIVVEQEVQAQDIMLLLEDGASFTDLALQYSIDEYTASNGGKIGLIDEDDIFYPEPLLEAAASLDIGAMTGPIRINDHYALVRLDERQLIKDISEEERTALIREQLATEQADSLQQVLERLLIEYNSLIKKQKL